MFIDTYNYTPKVGLQLIVTLITRFYNSLHTTHLLKDAYFLLIHELRLLIFILRPMLSFLDKDNYFIISRDLSWDDLQDWKQTHYHCATPHYVSAHNFGNRCVTIRPSSRRTIRTISWCSAACQLTRHCLLSAFAQSNCF